MNAFSSVESGGGGKLTRLRFLADFSDDMGAAVFLDEAGEAARNCCGVMKCTVNWLATMLTFPQGHRALREITSLCPAIAVN